MKKVTDNETTLSKKPERGTANQNHSSDYLIEIFEVPNSPISIVKEDEIYFVTLGKYKLSQNFNTKKEAMTDAQRKDMNRLIDIMGVVSTLSNLITSVKEK